MKQRKVKSILPLFLLYGPIVTYYSEKLQYDLQYNIDMRFNVQKNVIKDARTKSFVEVTKCL